MPKIYQQLIDKAVIIGAITPEQYLQIPFIGAGYWRKGKRIYEENQKN